jgi:hypothetical protein
VTADDRNPETALGESADVHDSIHHDEIRVKGHLAPHWTAWFDDLAVTAVEDGITVISGPVADQSALHGLLQKLRDIGLPLLSLTQTAAATHPQLQQRN